MAVAAGSKTIPNYSPLEDDMHGNVQCIIMQIPRPFQDADDFGLEKACHNPADSKVIPR